MSIALTHDETKAACVQAYNEWFEKWMSGNTTEAELVVYFDHQ